MQRHNKLLEVIKDPDSDISAIVSKRRKDFTKEFFVHLHTVAESYYDNPSEQNGETKKKTNHYVLSIDVFLSAIM